MHSFTRPRFVRLNVQEQTLATKLFQEIARASVSAHVHLPPCQLDSDISSLTVARPVKKSPNATAWVILTQPYSLC
jgi:hypothetical protein